MSYLLSCENMSFAYKGKEVFKDLNLNIDKGHKIISLIGADGSGKSTFLKIICNLLKPQSGSVSLKGQSIRRCHGRSGLRLGYMSQSLNLYSQLSVLENLKLFANLKDADTKSDDIYLNDLKKVGLYEFRDYTASSLSGGMRQKLSLVCTMAGSPDILVLDEPTVGVDPYSRLQLWDLILDYVDKKDAICIFSSLYLEESVHSDMTLLLSDGTILAKGRACDLAAKADRRCFSIQTAGKDYLPLARFLSLYVNSCKVSFLDDALPRLGNIDIIAKEGEDEISLYTKLTEILKSHGLSCAIKVTRRKALLEDGYMILTQDNNSKADIDLFVKSYADSRSYTKEIADKKDGNEGKCGKETAQISGLTVSVKTDAATGFFAESKKGADSKNDTESKDTKEIKKGTESKDNKESQNGTEGEDSQDSKDSKDDDHIVKVCGIVKRFGDFFAVKSSDFFVKRGEIFGLLGPNGAGKTTTFRMICALLNPSSGTILIENINLMTSKSKVRARIGYVAQKFSLYKNLSTYDNLVYFAKSYGLYGDDLKNRVDLLSSVFNLKPFFNIKTYDLPFGVQRQLSMCAALLHRPAILFLDEATSGADPRARRSFFAIINALTAMGTSVIVTTHFMEEAEYCDRFLIQDKGSILLLGRPCEICTDKDGRRISVEQTFLDVIKKSREGL